MSQNFEYTQEIILDVDPNSAYPVINAKQNDVDSRVLVVQLIKNNEKYSIPRGNVVWLRYCKPDKHTGEIQGEVNSNGTVSITLTKQCLAVAGRVYADLVEFDGVNTTGKVISTASFIINVQASPNSMSNPDTFSSDEFLALKQFVDRGLEIIAAGGSSGSGGNANFWFGTRAEYNAISQKDPNICYCIEEGT